MSAVFWISLSCEQPFSSLYQAARTRGWHCPNGHSGQKLDKLESILEGPAESRTEDVSLLAALLSIPFEDRYPRLQFTELVQKQRTLELLVGPIGPDLAACSGAGCLRGRPLDRSKFARIDE